MGSRFRQKGVWDMILVGGGLANGLLAYRLLSTQPGLRVLLIEKGNSLGGNHTWAFHNSDLAKRPDRPDGELGWLKPLISQSWDQYSVQFPGLSKTFQASYHAIISKRFHYVISSALGSNLILNQRVKKINTRSVVLEDGREFKAPCVIDGSGYRNVRWDKVGYKKFVGLDVTLKEPHGLAHPVLMDALCMQEDGFRFFYMLPWSEHSLLIEDTRYSNSGRLDLSEQISEITEFIEKRGWRIESITREEVGILPLPYSNDYIAEEEDDPSHSDKVPSVGSRIGLFHPISGYSLPETVRLVEELSTLDPNYFESTRLSRWLQGYMHKHEARIGYFRFLNRMIFLATPPEERYRLFQRFYSLSPTLIERFYAGNLKISDCVRILTGQPPVPLRKSLSFMLGSRSQH